MVTESKVPANKVVRPVSEDGSPLYPDYMPFYDPLEKVEDIGPFEHFDPGHRADPAKPNLFKDVTKMWDISPHIGTEIHGVQVSQLSPEGLDELALLAAERGAVVFRNQDFKDLGFEKQKDIVRHFGPLHVHGWAPHPKNGPVEHMIIYDHKDDLRVRKSWARQSPIQFHTDQSPEPQTPGTTFICMLESPSGAGGDTIISSSVRAFERLSPRFRKRLEGLTAIHSNSDVASAEINNNGTKAVMRRDMVSNEHPVVIVHPVTKRKALYVNPVYTRRIVGFDKEESDYLLKFLFDHIIRGQDFSCRVRYEPGTVLVWDQRVTNHSQTLDYAPGERRHAFRLTPIANKPIPSLVEEDDGECEKDEMRAQLNIC
ncbi:TauD-domain-containing protein [Gymnopus androsaceus JB14]|uniref:TauD-domain-containing protein n=1 Tax=Gymnopus androsaceus JB14 TaxID=1447944 RepID=A0A6A4I2C2_9AGAR|nr:TauD-domain-containing protein [Gymnopus androsaceus JB14]